MESGKEAGVPGLRGPVPGLRMGPTRGVASGRAAARIPPARSARGPRPAAPAAPRTRRAALVTGGGGLGDPGGLGVGRPGGREAGVRAAVPALGLSLLSILYLMRRQTGQHPRTWTVTQPAGTCSWHLAAASPASPPIGAQTSASIHFPLTHLHTGRTAHDCPQVPPPSPSTRPCLPQPTSPPSCLCSPSGSKIHAPTPRLPASGTGGCHRLQMGWGWSVRPDPLASPRDAGTCREEQLRLPAHWLGETKNRVSSASPSPSWTRSAPPPPPAAAALTSCSGLPRLQAGSPVVGLGGSASAVASSGQARGGGCGLWR